MATAGSQGLAWLLLILEFNIKGTIAHYDLFICESIGLCCKRHDSPAAGGDEQASLILQPVDCKRLKRMKPE